jgi:hypothetical protein
MTNPDPKSASDCERELLAFYPQLAPKLIRDEDEEDFVRYYDPNAEHLLATFAEISFALAYGASLDPYLTELETQLKKTWQEKMEKTTAKTPPNSKLYAENIWTSQKQVFGQFGSDAFQKFNLLAMVLTQLEIPRGFTVIPVQPPIIQTPSKPSTTKKTLEKPMSLEEQGLMRAAEKTIIMDGVLRPDQFQASIGEHLPWVDLGAGPEHGYLTHRIQWYSLYTNKSFVHFTPEIVGKALVFSKKMTTNSDPVAVWDFMFDRVKQQKIRGEKEGTPHYSTRADDFRSPEVFNDYLKKSGDKFPILAAFVNKPNLSLLI